MVRVTIFQVSNSESVKFASMSVAEAEAFVEEGRKLLDRKQEVTAQEWLSRRNAAVIASLKKANGPDDSFTEERLKNEFDNPTLDDLYRAILKFSGLNPGEPPAATDSASSAAA